MIQLNHNFYLRVILELLHLSSFIQLDKIFFYQDLKLLILFFGIYRNNSLYIQVKIMELRLNLFLGVHFKNPLVSLMLKIQVYLLKILELMILYRESYLKMLKLLLKANNVKILLSMLPKTLKQESLILKLIKQLWKQSTQFMSKILLLLISVLIMKLLLTQWMEILKCLI